MKNIIKNKIVVTIGLILLNSTIIAQRPVLDWALENDGSAVNIDINHNTIGTDSMGNVYTAGSFYGTIDFDPGPGVNNLTATQYSAFIQKLDANGNLVWVYPFYETGAVGASVQKLVVSENGTVTMIGYFGNTVDFDPSGGTYDLTAVNPSNSDMFILQISNFGILSYAKQLGAGGYLQPFDLVTDHLDNIFICGRFAGTIDFDPSGSTYNLTSPGSGLNAFALKLDVNGNFVWAQQFGGIETEYVSAAGIKPSGNLVITGGFNFTVDFDPGAGVYNLNSSTGNTFVLELDVSGNLVWAKNYGEAIPYGLDVSSTGDIYTVGVFYPSGTIDMDPGAAIYQLSPLGGSDIFIQKLDPTGNFLWVQSIASGSDEAPQDIKVDLNDNPVYCGYYRSSLDFDPGAGAHVLDLDYILSHIHTFISSLDASGSFKYALDFRGRDVEPNGLAVNDNLYIAGNFDDTTDFDPSNNTAYLIPNDVNAAFMVKLIPCSSTSASISATGCGTYTSPSGNHVWSVAGTYVDTISNSRGCDSILTINLTIINTDLVITLLNGAFTVGETGASYQWINCATNNIIAGATSQSYYPTTNGGYAAIVTHDGCTDTTNCYNIIDVGLEDYGVSNISLFPNPTTDVINLSSSSDIEQITIMDMSGKVVQYVTNLHKSLLQLNVSQLSKGIYIVSIKTNEGIVTKRLIKN